MCMLSYPKGQRRSIDATDRKLAKWLFPFSPDNSAKERSCRRGVRQRVRARVWIGRDVKRRWTRFLGSKRGRIEKSNGDPIGKQWRQRCCCHRSSCGCKRTDQSKPSRPKRENSRWVPRGYLFEPLLQLKKFKRHR